MSKTEHHDPEDTSLVAYRFKDENGRYVMNAPPGEEQEEQAEKLTLFTLQNAIEFAEFNGLTLVREAYILANQKESSQYLDPEKPAHTVEKDDWLFFEGEGGELPEDES